MFDLSINFVYKIIASTNGKALATGGTISAAAIAFFKKLTVNAQEQNLIVIILCEAVFILLFFFFLFIDYITGVKAAKFENQLKENPSKDWKKSDKLYRTIWKFFGVLMISFIVSFTAFISEIIDSVIMWPLLWALVVFWVLACSFEFHSIGENIKRWSGSKPPIFEFWDKITRALENRAINKVSDQEANLPEQPQGNL